MRNRKNVIMIVLCIVAVFMATGYAILSTNLSINGTSTLTGSWGIRIISITSSATGRAYNISDPTYQDTSMTFEVGVKEPGDKMTFTVEVENFGNIGAILNSIDASASGAEGIIYSINGIQEQERLAAGAKKKFTITTEFDINATKLPDVSVKELIVKLNYIQDDDQELTPIDPEISDEIITLPTLSSKILSDNTAYADNVRSPYVNSDTGIDFSQVSSAENGQGLYYTNKNTEDGKTTYYFRGDVDNNYVKFGQGTITTAGSCTYNGTDLIIYGETESNITEEECLTLCIAKHRYSGSYYLSDCGYTLPMLELVDGTPTYTVGSTSVLDLYWRIVRINEDGSVRLIYNGASVDAIGSDLTIGSTYYNNGSIQQVSRSSNLYSIIPLAAPIVSSDNAYVGYMYGQTGQSGDNAYNLTHANDNPSTIKTYLDGWYTSKLSSFSSYLADAGFCNDRSIASSAGVWASGDSALGYGNNTTYYGAYNRLFNEKQPQFVCPNASNDLFTTSTSSKGNKALSAPIGLITVDEVVYAGGVPSTNNLSYYLYTGYDYWTMSPSNLGGLAFVWFVYSDGSLDDGGGLHHYFVGNSLGVRPVINLKSGVEILSGNGTKDKPYVIK